MPTIDTIKIVIIRLKNKYLKYLNLFLIISYTANGKSMNLI